MAVERRHRCSDLSRQVLGLVEEDTYLKREEVPRACSNNPGLWALLCNLDSAQVVDTIHVVSEQLTGLSSHKFIHRLVTCPFVGVRSTYSSFCGLSNCLSVFNGP